MDLPPFIYIQFTNLLCYCLQRPKESDPARHLPTSTHTVDHSPLEWRTEQTCRWGDILESIFLCVKLLPPHTPHTPPRLSLSQHRALWLTAHSPSWGRRFEKGISRNRTLLLTCGRQDGLLAWGREWWRWGTRLHPAVEMAVSIKYHFQFPCFMIPGLLSTNNPPIPPGRPSYLVLKKIDYTCRLL